MISSIWHPSTLRSPRRRTLVYMICGNPGLIGYYTDFLEALRGLVDDHEATSGTAYDMYGRNLLGFSDAEHEPFGQPWDLDGQVEGVYEHVVAKSQDCDDGLYHSVILVGHSIGAYMAVDIFRRHLEDPSRAPHLKLDHGFLLFPTIASIGLSSAGRRMQLLRRVPTLDTFAHAYARLALLLVSRAALGRIVEVLMGFSTQAAELTAEWLKSRDGVRQSVHLGLSELDVVRDEPWDDELWASGRFYALYAGEDHWVADEVRDDFVRRRSGTTHVEVDAGGLKHAFCTTEHGSWVVAKHVLAWIEDAERRRKS